MWELEKSPSTCSSALRVESSRAVLIPETIHDTSRYANNRAELSHEPTRVRERGMRKFKSMQQAQRFLSAHAAVYNLFNLGRHLVSAENYRYFRLRAFASWDKALAI
ncbi:MAG: IS6 family transposase [Proteobacteria bacterium]|nr:IS6 family transposase [Pseudomonadota bacterium]